ncbi:unnamed protein product [Strongylus vulgaris]|uniref:Diacylglycerol kinase type I N-terminal domain-containing protein n=1 Tax=Strongylus vulgaris TaxID=40348 RepID=A0A3P7IY50_STRVU|nr:unnamed protein product [Strongylus vulgaris]
MLVEFQPQGKFFSYLDLDEQGHQTINMEGFKKFLSEYFEADLPPELLQQLSLSFSKAPRTGWLPYLTHTITIIGHLLIHKDKLS